MRAVLTCICAGLSIGAIGVAMGGELRFHSGPAQVALIELFTSEGCSSCPPAEAWLNALRDDPGLWRDFVPVAFHVNYWDRLGWKDALASKAFTDRQHTYAARWNSASVYTPCFVRAGTEWRPSNGSPGKGRNSDAGVLAIAFDPDQHRCRVNYQPAETMPVPRSLDVSVALLGGGIVSNVRKGENAGRELRHEFVALRLEAMALQRGDSGEWHAEFLLLPRTDIAVTRQALAVWITSHGDTKPVQAAGSWLNPK